MSSVHEPDFSGTTESDWSSPDLEDFDTDDLSEVDDYFIAVETEFPPENFSELKLPVVEPNGDLNVNALRNAKARLSQTEGLSDEDRDRAETIINNLAEDNFPDTDFNSKDMSEEEKSEEQEEAEEERSEQEEAPAVHSDNSLDEIKTYFDKQKEENSGYEKRVFQRVEVRQDEQDAGTIEGLGAVINVQEDIGQFKEVIRPGAFKKTIKEQDVRGLFNHDPNFVIGRTSSGTLELEENENGLVFSNKLPDTQFAQDLKTLVQRGDITGASIGFQVVREEFSEDPQTGDPMREILELKLFDVGPVTFPAFPQTDISARSSADYNEHRSNIYRADQKVGFDFKDLTEIILRSEGGVLCDSQDAEKLDSYIDHLKTLRRSVIMDSDSEQQEQEDSDEDEQKIDRAREKEKTRVEMELLGLE